MNIRILVSLFNTMLKLNDGFNVVVTGIPIYICALPLKEREKP